MSAISSERPNPPPNGDHCEVTDVLVDSTPNTSKYRNMSVVLYNRK